MIGRTISHYEVLQKLGEGGMGVVYLARDTDLGRLVALKFLRPHLVDSPSKIARFRQEARAISALNHPHIATIFGIEEDGEHKFLALEYLPGGTLEQTLAAWKSRGERLPFSLAIDWTIQIAEGLAHAHGRGIVHRDVKASNVLFTEDGHIKIADFGLAKIAAQKNAGLTDPGATVGTPPSMSPEQALGHPVDQRSDIFSLGLVLFESIAGEMPFRGLRATALLREIVYTPAPPLSRFREDVPGALQAVVSKALEKNPESRYQSMAELVDALRPGDCVPESTRPQDPSTQLTATMTRILPLRRRSRWKAAVGAMLVAGIPILAGIPHVRHETSNWFHTQPLPAKRIAVLEFKNIGNDPRNQALTDSLMEVVSSALTRMEHGTLQVVPATDVRKERLSCAADAWARAAANLAITGSVGRTGDSVVVTINLVDTRSVTQLRTETLKAGLGDAGLSDRVVERVAHLIDPSQPQDAQFPGPPATRQGARPPGHSLN